MEGAAGAPAGAPGGAVPALPLYEGHVHREEGFLPQRAVRYFQGRTIRVNGENEIISEK